MRRPAILLAAVAVAWSTLGGPAAAIEPGPESAGAPDVVPPAHLERSSPLAAPNGTFDGDPLGLVAYPHDARRYSLSTDRFGVYLCTWPGADGGVDLAAATGLLNSEVTPYFTDLSGGAYRPVFTARAEFDIGTQNAHDPNACARAVLDGAVASTGDNAAFAVLDNRYNGGLATSGWECQNCSHLPETTFPDNERWAVVDGWTVTPLPSPSRPPHLTTAVHEIGHTISWPHSFSGVTSSQYDNPIDVMSANATADGSARSDQPYATVAFNRYRAGWIAPSDVIVYRGGVLEATVAPVGVGGTQMIVLPTDDPLSFLTLDARIGSSLDPIPASFEGVTAQYVDQECGGEVCAGTASATYTYPPSPHTVDHVTPTGGQAVFDFEVGEPLQAEGTTLTVLGESAAGLQVRLVGFDDIGGTIFDRDVVWLATAGITLGCSSFSYCPDDPLTRGQMAAFLTRALHLTDPGTTDFVDDDASVFEADIEKLAAAGITAGCNPPANDRYCPNDPVTRGQMAAFLTRALHLTDPGTTDFVDDDASIFETDIEKLAAAGITAGCNPPANDRYCPNDPVTRGQMAAFLHRAFT